jgi:hypothetical protein
MITHLKDRDRLTKLLSFMLVLCPGFSTAAVGRFIALFPSRFSHPIAPESLLLMAIVTGIGFGILFGGIYTWLDPEIPKCEGKVPPMKMLESIGWFLLLQVFVAPVVCGIAMVFLAGS